MIKSLTFFENGNTMAFDEQGVQMGDVQRTGWLQLYLERLEEMSYDPRAIPEIRTIIRGKWRIIRPFKTTDGGWNYSFEVDTLFNPDSLQE